MKEAKTLTIYAGKIKSDISPYNKFKPLINPDGSLSIIITPKNKNKVIDTIAKQVIIKSYELYLRKYLKGKFNDVTLKAIIKNHISSGECEMYFLPFSKFAIAHFLKNNDKINIDVFVNFNLRGMKQELKLISEYEILSNGHYLQATDDFAGINMDFEPSESTKIVLNIEESIEKIKERYKKDESNEHVLIFSHNGQTVLLNNKMIEINKDFFDELAEEKLELYKTNPEIDELLKSNEKTLIPTLYLIMALEIFNPVSVVVFGELEGDFVDRIKEHIRMHNDNVKNKEDETDFFVSSSSIPRKIT